MKEGDLIKLLVVAGGGLALYYYLNNYGPNGAIATVGGLSWWATWFGTSTGATTSTTSGGTSSGTSSGTPTIPPSPITSVTSLSATPGSGVQTTYNGVLALTFPAVINGTSQTLIVTSPTSGAPTGVYTAQGQNILPLLSTAQLQTILAGAALPGSIGAGTSGTIAPPVTTPAPVQSGLVIPTNLVVSPNINNSLSGDVQLNGIMTNLSIIPSNLSLGVGLIYNSSGNDISTSFTPTQQQALVQAFTTAPQSPTAGLTGLRAGLGIIMPISPFITPATNGVANAGSLSPVSVAGGVSGLAGLGMLRGLGVARMRRGQRQLPSVSHGNTPSGWVQ